MIINHKWIADNADGTYTNPILYTDYSDPDVCRVGADYFMTASSFCNAPGLPILHSGDLVNWTLINYAIDRVPGAQYDTPQHGKGVWAPAIRYHNGEYIIFFPMPDEGIYVVKTRDPWGKWDEPTQLFAGKGWIDPCPFWDDDGRAYMVSAFAKSRIGFKSVLNLCEITPDCLHMIDEGRHIFDGNTENQETIEGPKLYKRNGYYYIFAPAGGVKQGWQTVLRSRSIWGPYEYRNVLMQKDTTVNGPHQGAWVDTPGGEDWFIHFQDVYAAGRITHLQPMRWEHDWPIIGEAAAGETSGKPVATWHKPNVGCTYPITSPATEDDFTGDTLGLQWQWNANPGADWYRIDPVAHELILTAQPQAETISNQPNLLLQKWSMPECSALTCLRLTDMAVGDCAGLVSLGVTYGAIVVKREADGFSLRVLSGEQHFVQENATAQDKVSELATLPADTGIIYLGNRITRTAPTRYNRDGAYTFPVPAEEIALDYSLDGVHYTEAYAYPSLAGRWVGVKHGLCCTHTDSGAPGAVRIAYFHYR